MCAIDFLNENLKKWLNQHDAWLSQFEFDLQEPERINYPGKPREIIRSEGDGYTLTDARWGFDRLPSKQAGGKPITYNARSETVDSLPLFQEAFSKRRCLLIATSYGEWADQIDSKQLIKFSRKDGHPFAYAGIWDRSRQGDDGLTCALLTTTPNDLVADFHSRMPVILDEADLETWLDPASSPNELRELLVPCDSEAWRMELAELPPRQTKYEKATAAGQSSFDF